MPTASMVSGDALMARPRPGGDDAAPVLIEHTTD